MNSTDTTTLYPSAVAKCKSIPLNNNYNLLFVEDIINPSKNIFINTSRKTLRSTNR
jgi:hypothetical protein